MSYTVHSSRLVLYGCIALFILYISLQSSLPSSATRRFGGLGSHTEVNAGLQQLGDIGKPAHAVHSFNYVDNIPNFKHLPTYSDLEASFLGLSKRDVCADTFPGTVKNTCTPGHTLCCQFSPSFVSSFSVSHVLIKPTGSGVSLTNPFPQCQVIINSGYCCVSKYVCLLPRHYTVADHISC